MSPVSAPYRLAVLGLTVVVLAGCVGPSGGPGGPTDRPEATASPTEPAATATQTPTNRTDKHPTLETTLYRLAKADDRSAVASQHDLQVRDGQVLVVVELEENASLPAEPTVNVSTRAGTEVQAYVDIDDLIPLAEADGVRYVRSPIGVDPHDSTTAS